MLDAKILTETKLQLGVSHFFRGVRTAKLEFSKCCPPKVNNHWTIAKNSAIYAFEHVKRLSFLMCGNATSCRLNNIAINEKEL